MGFYRLTNVPTEKSGVEIKGIVENEQINIVACQKDGKWREGGCILMGDTYLGDHMLSKPEALRLMYANDLASAIRMGRDAGYEQALADVRAALGIKR